MANTGGSQYTYITAAATTIIGPAASTFALPTTGRRLNILGLGINKTLVGTMTVKSGATTIGSFAVGTAPNVFWWTAEGGIEVYDPQIVTTATEDITIFWNNL